MQRSPSSDDRPNRADDSQSRELSRSLLDRRNYLKLTGAAAVAGLGATGTAAAADYDEVVVGEGENRVVRIDSGETWENKLVDLTADNAKFRIRPQGDDWAIRNIGIKGQPTKFPNSTYLIGATVDSGGTGVIENIYMGDGGNVANDTIGIFVTLDHAGTLKIRDCNIQGMPNNGIYGAAPGRSHPDDGGGGGGAVHIENCYSKNNNLDGYRVGTDGSYVKDSVVVIDEQVPYAYQDPSAVNARGIWVKEGGDCVIDNCDIKLTHPSASYCVWVGDDEEKDGVARLRNSEVFCSDAAKNDSDNGGGLFKGDVRRSNVGRDPDVSIPNGVPTSASQAASGGGKGDDGGGGDDADGEHLLVIEGQGTHVDYSFTVTENLQRTTDGGGSIQDSDTVHNQSAVGAVGGGVDAYRFDGNLISFDFEGGPINVSLDGGSANVGQLPDHCLQILAQGDSVDYSFTVSDGLRKSRAGGASISSSDNVIGGITARGGVGGSGSDAYKFNGDLEAFDFSGGSIYVLLDGQSAHVGQRPEHFLLIEGQGSRVDYNFTVSGDLAKSEAGEATADGQDTISNNESASGHVGSGKDAYTFDGELRAFDFDDSNGGINVLLDGDSARVGQLPDQV